MDILSYTLSKKNNGSNTGSGGEITPEKAIACLVKHPQGDFGKIMDKTKFRSEGGRKMTTYEKFFAEHPEQKELYDKEYSDFLLSEFMLEQMEAQHISVRELAKRADVSPTVIQKLRSKDSQKVNLSTFISVLKSLGYQIKMEKISVFN